MRAFPAVVRRTVSAAGLATLALVATACNSGGSNPQAGSTYTPAPYVTPTPIVCPTPAHATAPKWPAGLLKTLPKPPVATIQSTAVENGITITRFLTPTSLRDSTIFVIQKLPAAGFRLGRGDAEYSEADAPFVGGGVRGQIRLAALAPCQTLWLVATVGGAGAGLLIPYHPGSSPSPLPSATSQPFGINPAP